MTGFAFQFMQHPSALEPVATLEKTMNQSISLAAIFVICTFSLAAHAETRPEARSEGKPDGKASSAVRVDSKSVRHGGFPMPAAEFRQKQEARVAKSKTKMEDRIRDKKLSSDRAKLVRSRFEYISGKVNGAVAKAAADGSVTKDESNEVNAVARQARRDARTHKDIKSERSAGSHAGAKKDEPGKPLVDGAKKDDAAKPLDKAQPFDSAKAAKTEKAEKRENAVKPDEGSSQEDSATPAARPQD